MNLGHYIKKLVTTVFSKGHDTSTEEGRAKERARRIGQTALAAMSARTVNIFTGLLTVPITLPYLGIELFGIWMALTGFVAFLSFSDLGLSIGLQTKLTECHGKDDRDRPSFLISSTFLLISLLFTLLCLIAYFFIPMADVVRFIPVETHNIQTLEMTAQSLIYTFAFGLFATIFQRIFESYQDGLYSNSLLAIGRVFSFLSVYFCVYFKLPLPILIALFMGMPFVFLIIGGIVLMINRPWLRPSILKVRIQYIIELFKIGYLAMRAQIGFAIMTSGPLLVLTSQFGAAAIVPFALIQRLSGVVAMLLGVALGPLWPAYGEAKQRGDWGWVSHTFKKSGYLATGIVVPSSLVLVLFGQDIIQFWSGEASVVTELNLIVVCVVWMILLAGIQVNSMLLNGLGEFKGQATYGLILPIIAITLASLFGHSMPLVGCLLFMIIMGDFTRFVAMAFEVKHVFKKH